MPKQLRKLFIPLMLSLISLPSFALSIGEITLHSTLGQPLNAQLSINNLGDLQAAQMIIRHTPLETYDKLKIERPTVLQAIAFNIVTHNKQSYIQLSTKTAINEPYIRFLVHIRWPQGELLKEITLLLDPG